MRPYSAIIAVATLAGLAACGGDDTKDMAENVDPETFATMTTCDVQTLVSDSGITRYRIIAPLWLVYDEAREPYWRFPKTLHLERFDPQLRIEATVDCDSAIYFKNKQLWRLDGNVHVLNTLGERFLTEQLFWDQRNEKVYSDSFIHIERADRTLEGYGFESNQRMTRFTVRNVSAILPASQFSPGQQRDSVGQGANAQDSLREEMQQNAPSEVLPVENPVADSVPSSKTLRRKPVKPRHS